MTGFSRCVGCVAVLSAVAALCACSGDDVRITPADGAPPPDAANTCNLVAQDCAGPDEKCTIVDRGDGMTLVPACVPVTGAAANNEPCARTSETSTGWGHDDCAPGYWCSGVGVLSPAEGGSRICRRYCTQDLDCAGIESCMGLYSDGDTHNAPTGFCTPRCQVLSADCSAIDPRLDCVALFTDVDGSTFLATCWSIGTVPRGGDCTSAGTACVAQHWCLDLDRDGQRLCEPLCVDSNDCPNPTQCTQLPGVNGGFCQ